ncbi:MAG TPA: insulinase family protein, partial [Bacillota bacterium]|nr:insulinase family protein [Bacillota bacterium]
MTFFKRMIIGLFLLLGLLGQTIFATNLDYQIKELPNGIKLVYKVLPGAKTTSARIIFPVGFLNEPPQFSNISHLLEHMVFRGSETYQAEDFQRRVV